MTNGFFFPPPLFFRRKRAEDRCLYPFFFFFVGENHQGILPFPPLFSFVAPFVLSFLPTSLEPVKEMAAPLSFS